LSWKGKGRSDEDEHRESGKDGAFGEHGEARSFLFLWPGSIAQSSDALQMASHGAGKKAPSHIFSIRKSPLFQALA
jgi:hypothetical protein